MQSVALRIILQDLPPLFFIIELARAALWVARAVDEPDRDGPLLRILVALIVGIFSFVPSPVWALTKSIAWVAWMPIRGILLLWGIGREGVKKGFPTAVTQWYESTRAKRAEMLQR